MADNVLSDDTAILLGQETQPRSIIITADQIEQISKSLKEQINVCAVLPQLNFYSLDIYMLIDLPVGLG